MSTPLEEGGPEDLALYINIPDVGRWVGIDMDRYLSASAPQINVSPARHSR